MKKSEIKDIYNESKSAIQLIKAKSLLLPFAKDIDELALTIAEDIRLFFPIVKKMCDYMIDDGSEDFSELLQDINNEMRQIESDVAKFGYSKARFVLLQNCRAIINNIKDVDIWAEKTEGTASTLEYYCKKAIEKGYLIKTNTGYKRVQGEWTKALLAYFLERVIFEKMKSDIFPDKDMCLLFEETRLSKAIDQLKLNKNAKPKGYDTKVDPLFDN